MYNSKIEWVDSSWNPVMGCSKISTGCTNCFAMTMINRYAGLKGWPITATDVTLFPERLEQPLTWKKPRSIFVCSMSDLFHSFVPFEFIERVWRTMHIADQHTYLVLTKRAERMLEFQKWFIARFGNYEPPPHIGLGVTGENAFRFYQRYAFLRHAKARVRFVSFEPMLEAINLGSARPDWVICGAESGPQRRPFKMQWARDLKDQCVAAGIPFFFKQGHDAAGNLVKMPELDGQVWAQFPGPRA